LAKVWIAGVLVTASGSFSVGCVRASDEKGQPGVEVKCLSADLRPTTAPLPDSHWLRVDGGKVEKLSSSGELAWATKLPVTDAVLPGFSVAPNATVYMRDKQRVLALGSDGAWLWERPEPIRGATDATYQPVAMSDSGVIVRSGQQQFRAYSHTGTLRWSVDVDLKGGPCEKPIVLPNGRIILQGANDSVCLSPDDGTIEWRQTRS
jgi:outer membrane protein assembly factor BamB